MTDEDGALTRHEQTSGETSYILVSKTASKMAAEIGERIENEWHTGDEWDELVWKQERLERFIEYLRLKQQFEP